MDYQDHLPEYRWKLHPHPQQVELDSQDQYLVKVLLSDLRGMGAAAHWLRVGKTDPMNLGRIAGRLYRAGMVAIQPAPGYFTVRLDLDHPRVLELLWSTK